MNKDMRFHAMGEIGCVVCAERGFDTPAERHHLLTTGLHGNGRRRGHHCTVSICAYHHRGESAGSGLAELFNLGPNYADHAREFRKEWPDEKLLLATNRALREYADNTIGVTYEQLGCEVIG